MTEQSDLQKLQERCEWLEKKCRRYQKRYRKAESNLEKSRESRHRHIRIRHELQKERDSLLRKLGYRKSDPRDLAESSGLKSLLMECPEEIKDYVSELEQQNIKFFNRLHSADAQLQLYAGEVYRLKGERQILTMLANELIGMLELHAPATVTKKARNKRESILNYITGADENAKATAKAVQEDVDADN